MLINITSLVRGPVLLSIGKQKFITVAELAAHLSQFAVPLFVLVAWALQPIGFRNIKITPRLVEVFKDLQFVLPFAFHIEQNPIKPQEYRLKGIRWQNLNNFLAAA